VDEETPAIPTPIPARADAGEHSGFGYGSRPALPPPPPRPPRRTIGPPPPSFIGKPVGRPAPPWYRTLFKLCVWGAVFAAAYFGGRAAVEAVLDARDEANAADTATSVPNPKINPQPPAPAPPGFQSVTGSGFVMALPSSWHVLPATRNPNLVDDPAGLSPPPADRWKDDRTGDGVVVSGVDEVQGDPRSADNVAAFERSFTAAIEPDLTDLTYAAQPTDVHGYHAEAFTIGARYSGRPVIIVATVIQTGDRVFVTAFTSVSLARAITLQSQMLPTFAPA
jgi:hypothetical protein